MRHSIVHSDFGLNLWLSHFLNEDFKKAFFFICGMNEFSKNIFHNSKGNSFKILDKLKEISLKYFIYLTYILIQK